MTRAARLWPVLGLFLFGACAGGPPRLPATEARAGAALGANKQAAAMIRVGDRLLAAGDMVGAANMYRGALDHDGRNSAALMRLGDIAWQSGAWKDAGDYYGAVLALEPANSLARIGQARALIVEGLGEEALALLADAGENGQATAETMATRALAYDALGRQEEAQIAYAEALDRAPDNTGIRVNMALSFAISEDYQTAIALLRELGDTPGQSAQMRQYLALIYALSGQTDAAIDLALGHGGEGAAALRAFYRRLPGLDPAAKAMAVFFRKLPPEAPPGPPPATISTPPAALEPSITAEPAKAPSPKPALALEATPPAASSGGAAKPAAGRYWAQVASFRTLAALELAWADISTRKVAAVRVLTPMVLTAEVAERGAYYRLMVGRFQRSAEAVGLCDSLKAAGVDCVVILNDGEAEPLRITTRRSDAPAKP